MANKLKCHLFTTISFFFLCNAGHDYHGNRVKKAQVQGMFVFGSSLVDNGNNNYLKNSTARADYHPYGIDFPLGPSGRFSNGRNPIDVLGELLKLPCLIPPFADPKTRGASILHGVNFASGGSGILDQTGSIAGEVMSLSQQIENFAKRTVPAMEAQLQFSSRERLSEHFSKYLFVVGTGGNDYLLNYFMSSSLKHEVSLTQFTDTLITTLSTHLRKLYEMGARKFVVLSIQAMGCIPAVRADLQVSSNGSCVEALNEAAVLFNSKLKSVVVDTVDSQLPGSFMVLVNSYGIIQDIINHPLSHGFLVTSKACCDVPLDGNGVLCRRRGGACKDRTAHVFFDGLHPTDAVNVRIAHKAYGSNLENEVYPTNVMNLARM